jgi:hypothetical protein
LVIGGSWAVFAWWLDVSFFIWSLPVAVPLILAAPTSVLLSRVRVDQCIYTGPAILNKKQISELCEDRVALAELHRRAWIAPTDSYWGQAIARL